MTTLFTIQLITAFLIGGGFIALLSLIAEKAPQKTAGIFLTLPSTVMVSFIFMSWATSAESTAEIVPSTLIPMATAMIFGISYSKMAAALENKIQSKIKQILISYLVAISTWLIIAIPIAAYQINNLFIGLGGWIIITIISHLILKKTGNLKAPSRQYSIPQIVGRSIFAGTIVAGTVILAKLVNPFWGGIFAMFPAAFSSSLIIFHWYYKPSSLLAILQKAPIGSISMLIFTTSVIFTFPKFGFIAGTITSYLLCLATTGILIKLQK